MADKKISQLASSATPLAGTEVLPLVQGGVTKQVSVANLTDGRSVSMADATVSTGNLIIGTSGKGIDFSATSQAGGMTSELLNDYEEGTFTATLTGSTGAPTTPVTTTGFYTKIGREVIVQFDFQGVNTAGATGGLQVTGLPYAAILNRIYAGSAVGNQAFSALQLVGSTIDVVTLATGANIPAGGAGIYLFCTMTYMT